MNESERLYCSSGPVGSVDVVEILKCAEIILARSPSEEPVIAIPKGIYVTAELDVVLSEGISKTVADLKFGVGSRNRKVVSLSNNGRSDQVCLLAGAIRIASAGFASKIDTEFVHLPALYGIHRKRAASALIDKNLSATEGDRSFVLAETTGKPARVIPRSVDAGAEVIGLADLPIVVPQHRQ